MQLFVISKIITQNTEAITQKKFLKWDDFWIPAVNSTIKNSKNSLFRVFEWATSILKKLLKITKNSKKKKQTYDVKIN